jgi:hypothetical protein
VSTKKQLEEQIKDLLLENEKLQKLIDDRIPLLRSEVEKMISDAINSHNHYHHERDDYI